MNSGALLIGIALLVLAGVALADPFVRERARRKVGFQAPREGGDSAANGNAVLYALRDLDFDFQTGKVTGSDYRSLRARMLTEAAASLQAAEERRQAAEAQLEKEVLGLRKVSGERIRCHQCGSRIEGTHRYCAHCGASLLARCNGCGSAVGAEDHYCPRCGRPLHHPEGGVQ